MALEFDGLVKRFGDKRVLAGLTVTVPDGELVGLCGANGSGKTTAMRIAIGVLRADQGEVRWRGAPLDDRARARIGYLPEERGLYPKLRPVDQVAYFAALSGWRPAAARRLAARWLERLDVRVGPKETLSALSLGNQQKVQLAAALVHEPELLLLDEPFSGLDPTAVDTMAAVLKELTATGVPVLFSSHQLDLVERLCDRVEIVHEGRRMVGGTVGELRRRFGARRLRIGLADARPPGWAARLPGVRVLSEEANWADCELLPGASSQEVLAAGADLGTVIHFGWHESALHEIFREVVQ